MRIFVYLLRMSVLFMLLTASAIGWEEPAAPDEETIKLETTIVYGKAKDRLGIARAASEGDADADELSNRPTLRRGELLEVVPGVTITQHAGGGKANQYFVRGHNLDHGTDFHVGVNGMPLGLRTHAHGQGYADLNIVVPEFVAGMSYAKGPYNASFGDFSSAGGADFRLAQELESMMRVTFGEDEYFRLVLSDSWTLGPGKLSLGGEFENENGPWLEENNFNRYNLLSRYHQGDAFNYLDLTVMAYSGNWDSSDQIPLRGIESGLVDRFGAIDDTTGGESSRYSVMLNWQETDNQGITHLDAWVGYYDLDLYSNFTYFLSDPVNGDQFQQTEDRVFAGMNLWRQMDHELGGKHAHTTVGVSTQWDFIDDIGLHLSRDRARLSTVRQDDVIVGSVRAYIQNETQLTDWMRLGGGVAGDWFWFDVDSNLAVNSGSEEAGILNPRVQLVFGPWHETEYYLNAGMSFHSNDARGTTITVDPTDGVTPVEAVDPLVRTKGAELGVRSQRLKDWTLTGALWYQESDSELVFVGDGGSTEASDASERWGVELSAYWRPNDWFTFDSEYTWSDAHFVGVPSGLREIPNSIEHTMSGGITIGKELGPYGSLRCRYFSSRPLEESGAVTADSSFLVNMRLGYRWDSWDLTVDVLNLFDRDDNDIEYFYESRLPGEPAAGVGDIHLHPVEPLQVRVSLTHRW